MMVRKEPRASAKLRSKAWMLMQICEQRLKLKATRRATRDRRWSGTSRTSKSRLMQRKSRLPSCSLVSTLLMQLKRRRKIGGCTSLLKAPNFSKKTNKRTTPRKHLKNTVPRPSRSCSESGK